MSSHFLQLVRKVAAGDVAADSVCEIFPCPVFFKDEKGRYRNVNRLFQGVFEKPASEILGHCDREIIGEDPCRFFERLHERVRVSGAVCEGFFGVSRKNFHVTVAPLRDRSGEVIGSAGLLIETEEKTDAREYLKELEERYRIVLERTNDAICIVEGGKIRLHNAMFNVLLGYSDAEIAHSSYLDFVHPDDRVLVAEQYRIRKTEDFPGCPATVYRFINKAGQIVWGRINSTRIRWKGRDALFCIAKDITSRKNLKLLLSHARKKEAIGTLAGGIAHDFNNILGALVAYTEASLYILPDNSEEIRSNLSKILVAGLRAKNLVRQIIDFSRPSENSKKTIDIPSLVHETIGLLRASIPSTIAIKCDTRVKSAYVRAYAEQIQMVLMNLGSNAAHAMRAGGGEFRIGVETVVHTRNMIYQDQVLQPGEYIRIIAADTGTGIAPNMLHRIFDPYFTSKKEEDGAGIGLAVSKEIIRQHHGAIAVRSLPGEGAVFDIYLPRVSAKPNMPGKRDAVPKGTEHILMIDDEELLISSFSHLLKALGYQLTGVADSHEALRLFEANPDVFDIVITDQTMPGLTGKELAEKMLTIRPEIPIILCTGYSDQIDREEALNMGIREFLMKPCKIMDLCLAIRKLVDTPR